MGPEIFTQFLHQASARGSRSSALTPLGWLAVVFVSGAIWAGPGTGLRLFFCMDDRRPVFSVSLRLLLLHVQRSGLFEIGALLAGEDGDPDGPSRQQSPRLSRETPP